ncbi:MAG: hypothetical protein AAF648_02765 [Pseudomonadota bacterium]
MRLGTTNSLTVLRFRFLAFAAFGIALAVAGFFPTYFRPLLIDNASFASIYHVHGLFGAAWLILFLCQTLFVQNGRLALHRSAGILGIGVVLGVMITLPWVAYEEVSNQLRGDQGTTDFVLGPVLDALTFGVLTGVGFMKRKDPNAHKRWMLLATVLLLWVAWVRLRYYFPAFPHNFNVFSFGLGMAPIPVFWLLDRMTTGAVHPVLLWGGIGLLLEQGLQLLFFGTQGWSALAHAVYQALTHLLA